MADGKRVMFLYHVVVRACRAPCTHAVARGSSMGLHRRVILLAPLLPVLSACERFKRKDQASRLTPSLQGYAASIRWGNLNSAYGFLRPRDGTPQPLESLEGLKVTGYTIRVNNVNESSDEAGVTMTFSYYFQDEGRLASTEQTALWYYDIDSNAWVIDGTALPKFR